jgi:hypothetical protein
MPVRVPHLQRLQHGLFQANNLLGQRVHQLNYQLCAPKFSGPAMREAEARTREALDDVKYCLDAIKATLAAEPAHAGDPEP